jgi:hypothetical protein
MTLMDKAKDHLNSVNETYVQHMKFAFYIGGMMIFGGILAILHGFCPAVFQRSGSKTICVLHEKITARMDQCKKQ